MNPPHIHPVFSGSLPDTKVISSHSKNNHFFTSLAHEVRNPLATIRLAVEVLQKTSTDHTQKKYLEMILKSNERINKIITSLLISLQPQINLIKEYPLHQLVEEVLKANEDRILLSDIKVTKKYTHLASAILANKEEIKVALTNIIINAIEALPASGGELIITTIADEGKCTLIIEDNGTGIDEEHLKDMFKPYCTTKTNGMGLGLSMTLSMLASNEVTVKVQSEKGVGTCFILSFDNQYAKIY